MVSITVAAIAMITIVAMILLASLLSLRHCFYYYDSYCDFCF